MLFVHSDRRRAGQNDINVEKMHVSADCWPKETKRNAFNVFASYTNAVSVAMGDVFRRAAY